MRFNKFINEEVITIKNIIDKMSRELDFRYKIQLINVYIKDYVEINKFIKKLEGYFPFEIRYKLKTSGRTMLIVNQGKVNGPLLFIVYFDGNNKEE